MNSQLNIGLAGRVSQGTNVDTDGLFSFLHKTSVWQTFVILLLKQIYFCYKWKKKEGDRTEWEEKTPFMLLLICKLK